MAENSLRIDRDTLKALGSDTRIEILKRLKDRQMTASELSKSLSKHVTTVAEHLEVLEKRRLVERVERPGRKWIYYRLSGTGQSFTSPTSHTFVLGVLASIVVIFSGAFLMQGQNIIGGSALTQDAAEKSVGIAAGVAAQAEPQPYNSIVAVLLIAAGVALLAYSIYRRIRH